ncbi:OTU domain-containing protein 7A-like isoform X2 [Arctopsyche grandis]
METNLVCELKKQTGASEELCYTLLEGQGWDITSALVAYMQLADLEKEHSKDRLDEGSRYNISGSWRATHDTPGEDCVDGTAPSTTFVQPATVKIDNVSNSKPVLQKTAAVDFDCKKLVRGISRATENENIVSQVRSECAQDVSNDKNPNVDQFYIDTPEYTFTLPDITIYSDEFRKFLEKDLLETSTLVSLEQSGRLNWWNTTGAARLWPLSTCGDGNCLPHAASLGLWGFHDRLLTLRKLLHNALLYAPWRHALQRRWRWTQTRQHLQSGLVLSASEWEAEWSALVARAAPANHSLEEIHVFALAHTLRRPIIVIADVLLRDLNGEAMAPIPFGGVYLPLECSPEDCHKSPLLLAYDMGHFSALVIMETQTSGKSSPPLPPVIPLSDSNGCLLPIQFSVDPGEEFQWNKDENDQKIINRLVLSERDQINLLSEYLEVVYLTPSSSPGQEEPDIVDLCEDDITNKFSEVLTINTDVEQSDHPIFDNKSKTAKQIHSVAKQFGSIGKSMSNKLKKNLGSITKITNKSANKKSNNFSSIRYKFLCCQLRAKRHAIQDQMVKNYLEYAEYRFLNSEQMKEKQDVERRHFETLRLREQAMLEGPLKCINAGCEQYGTALTSYMCPNCFQKQRQHELYEAQNHVNSTNNRQNGMLRYNTGKSKFYVESDNESHDTIRRMPPTSVINTDQTLYLSKSTFYNDTGRPSMMSARSVNNLDKPREKDWKNTSSDNLVNIRSESKKEKSKRSTMPAKVHAATEAYKPGWDSLPIHDESDALDIFDGPQPCRTPFCTFYGNPSTNYLCSKCCEMENTNQLLKLHKS